MTRHTRLQQGFTIIELTFAMLFLSFLMVFLAVSLVQMLRSYDKGITVKQIAQAGSTIGDDLSRRLRTASSTQDVITTNSEKGVICIGDIAYVWNPLYKSNKSFESATRFTFTSGEKVSLARWQVSNPQSPSSICNNPDAAAPRAIDSQNYPLLGGRSRVVWTDVVRSADAKLVKMTFYIGSYDENELGALSTTPAARPAGVYNTPYFASATDPYPICRPGEQSSYCFASTFTSTVYLPNALK